MPAPLILMRENRVKLLNPLPGSGGQETEMRQKGGEPYSKGVEPAGERSEYRPRQSLGVCGSNAQAQRRGANRKLIKGRDLNPALQSENTDGPASPAATR
jgi:hypothetical protein